MLQGRDRKVDKQTGRWKADRKGDKKTEKQIEKLTNRQEVW
jgi:hypothetical protein